MPKPLTGYYTWHALDPQAGSPRLSTLLVGGCHRTAQTLFVTGDMDLDPETGSYRLSATVPGVCLNELRKTLGIRPPPYAVAGAVRGVLHCSGPLDQPVFAGEPMQTC